MHLHCNTSQPMPRINPPVTPESIQAAKDDAQRVRADVFRQTGVLFDEEGRVLFTSSTRRLSLVPTLPVLFAGVPVETRDAVADAMDLLVEQYGVESVLRCARLIAAANGVDF